MKEMTTAQIAEKFGAGMDCSQVVLEAAAEQLGIDLETARKMGACFGGGIMGETCGAVAGAMIAIGLKYGHFEENNGEQKAHMMEKRSAYLEKFLKDYSSIGCRELLGYDLTKPEEFRKAMEENLLFTRCPEIVAASIKCLEEVL